MCSPGFIGNQKTIVLYSVFTKVGTTKYYVCVYRYISIFQYPASWYLL